MAPIYDNLNAELHQIRLLELRAAETPSGRVRCGMRTVNLSHPPPYEALSYVWGNPNDTIPIEVNGMLFDVTKNLLTALKSIWNRESRTLLWVDAICINQQKISERNDQVQLMRQIYMQADRAIVWLGESDNDSDIAIDLIKRWSSPLPPDIPRTEAVGVTELLKVVPNPFEVRAWEALRLLFARDYWKRSWILQEIVFSKKVLLLCGSKAIPWEALDDAQLPWAQLSDSRSFHLVNFDQLRLVTLSNYNTASRISYWRLGRKMSASVESALKLIQFTHDSGATDPRDKIYALLGFDSFQILELKPDYARSVGKVYGEFVQAVLEKERRLDILSFAGIGWPGINPSLELPSWVPDFRSSGKRSPPLKYFQASRNERPIAIVSGDSKILTARGVIYDAICSVDYHEEDQNVIKVFWQELALSQPRNHPTGISQLQAYFRTLIADNSGYGYGLPQFKDNTSKKRFFDAMAGMMWWLGKWALDNDKVSPGLQDRIKPAEARAILDMDDYIQQFILWSGLIPEIMTKQDLLAPFLEGVERKNRILLDEEESVKKGHNCSAMYAELIAFTCTNRSFFISEKGYMGLAPKLAKANDLICVLLGCDKPLIIRKVENHYVLIGDSYIYGMMEGEVIENARNNANMIQEIVFH